MADQENSAQRKPYTIEYIGKETPDVNLFKLKAADSSKLDFEPGMFVMLSCENPAEGVPLARAYSIASAPQEDYLEFIIGMIHGKFTSLLDNAKVGDTLYVSGPHGQFKFSPNDDKKVLFVAGGTGIAPFISMLHSIKLLGTHNDVHMLYSVRYPNEIIRKDELAELASQIGLKLNVTVTRPQQGDGWTGETGHIDADMVKRLVPDYGQRTAYICGPLAFSKAMMAALKELEVPESKVKADVWG